MNEDSIIQNLKNLDDIEPKNKAYLSNLKKVLINKREIINHEKELIKARQSRLLDFRFWFSSLSFMAIIVFALVILIDSRPDFTNDLNLTPQNNTESDKNVVMNVGNEKIIADEYSFNHLFIDFKLPQSWVFSNPDFRFERGQNPRFEAEDKFITFFSTVTNVKEYLTSTGATVIDIADYEVISSPTEDVDILNEFVEANVGESPSDILYSNNYWVKLGDPSMYLLFSFDSSDDSIFMESILDNLTFSNPMRSWEQLSFDRLLLRKSKDWDVIEDGRNQTVLKKNTILDRNETSVEFDQFLDIELSQDEFDDSELDTFIVYGRTLQKVIDDGEGIERFILPVSGEQVVVTRSIVINECEEPESTCNTLIADFADDIDFVEHLLVIWSIDLSDRVEVESNELSYTSDYGFSLSYPRTAIARSSLSNPQYASLREQFIIEFEEVRVELFVLNRETDEFVFDLRDISADFEWQSTPTKIETEVAGRSATKTEGIATIDENLNSVVSYLLNQNGNTVVINIYDNVENSSQEEINNIIESISFND